MHEMKADFQDFLIDKYVREGAWTSSGTCCDTTKIIIAYLVVLMHAYAYMCRHEYVYVCEYKE